MSTKFNDREQSKQSLDLHVLMVLFVSMTFPSPCVSGFMQGAADIKGEKAGSSKSCLCHDISTTALRPEVMPMADNVD